MQYDNDEEVEKILKEYLVPYPDEEEIEKTINCAEVYIKPKKVRAFERKKRLLYNTYLGFRFFPKPFFILSILIYILGYLYTMNSMYIYCMFIFVAPVPLILSLINIFRGKNENVWEVESVCKILPQEICVAKILIVAVFNTILNITLSVFLYETIPGLIFWKVTMLWLVPMVLTGAIALFVCSHVKSSYAVPTTLASWTVAAMAFSYMIDNKNILNNMSLWSCVILIFIGAIIFFIAMRKLTRFYSFERGTDYGTDNRKPFKTV